MATFGYCPIHGENSRMCEDSYHSDDSNKCIECNGGPGYNEDSCWWCYDGASGDDD